jgi:hypothetical protein
MILLRVRNLNSGNGIAAEKRPSKGGVLPRQQENTDSEIL